MMETLPTLLPNLASLTLTPTVHITTSELVRLIPRFPRLRRLSICGQDVRSRRRRLDEQEPEGEVGRALRALADEGGAGLRLRSLTILATPLKLSTLDYFLEICGEGLEVLAVESCGIGGGLTALVEAWCPRIQILRLDSLASKSAPPATPRPEADGPPHLDRSLPLALSCTLTSLHLSSLPTVDASVFSLFSDPAHAALKSLSLSHCDASGFSAAHLSHFAYITRLRIVACANVKTIPVFLARGRTDVGPGCQELRQVSLLGCSGLPLHNLWELAMLGREELGVEEVRQRKRLGLGRRGLKKLTVDGAEGRDQVFVGKSLQLLSIYRANYLHRTVSGVILSLPPGFGATSDPIDVDSDLPVGLLPPPHLVPYLSTNILSPTLPTPALLQTLAIAQDLEEIGLFGCLEASRPRPLPPSTLWTRSITYARQLPVVGPYITTFLFPHPRPATPPDWPPFQRQGNIEAAKGLPGVPWPTPNSITPEQGKRLSTAEVTWLLHTATGKLRKIYV